MEGFAMARCSKAMTALMVAGCFALSANSQTINLTGTVKDSATAQGIVGARCSLAVQKVATTTIAGGAYTLVGNSVRFFNNAQTEIIHSPMFNQNALMFGVAGTGERVKIDVYDVSGRRVAGLLDREIGSGNYQINPYLPTLARKIYFVKLQTGSQTAMFTMPLSNKLAAAAGGILRKMGGTADGALAKSAAVVDTLIVTATGHKKVSKPISAFIGANDVLLPATTAAGHLGFVTFDNASYSGCQSKAIIIVQDSDQTGATVSVHIKSIADSVGFMLTLRKDPTTFGGYMDSLGFSINSSDSTKRILKVQDKGPGKADNLTVTYHDLSPDTMLSMTGITWNGTTGQVGPGASIYAGLTTKATVNLSDADLTDSVAFVTVKNDSADTIGFQMALHPVPGSGGSYTGLLGFSTVASNPAKAIIKVKAQNVLAGENITLIYYDLTPPAKQVGSICTWRPMVGNIALDSLIYHTASSKMGITVYDDDIASDTLVVTIKSKKDATGILDTLKFTGASSGRVFAGSATFSTGASVAGKTIGVQATGDTVSVIYKDYTPDSTVVKQVPWSAN
jgi:hypothetical protein